MHTYTGYQQWRQRIKQPNPIFSYSSFHNLFSVILSRFSKYIQTFNPSCLFVERTCSKPGDDTTIVISEHGRVSTKEVLTSQCVRPSNFVKFESFPHLIWYTWNENYQVCIRCSKNRISWEIENCVETATFISLYYYYYLDLSNLHYRYSLVRIKYMNKKCISSSPLLLS